MVCLACSRLTGESLCQRCEMSLRPAPEQYLPGVGVVRAAFHHRGAARLLVHHLKYRGVVPAGRRLAEAMAAHVPDGVMLVPVPRVGWRLLRYGIDPALELARGLADLTGSPLARSLVAPFWGRPRAGRAHGFAPPFHLQAPASACPVVLIDDVVTSGATLIRAAGLFPAVAGAVTATSSGGPFGLGAANAELTSVRDGGSTHGATLWR